MAMLNRSLRAPSQRSAISRCPVLEIGRNSVTPSMMPSRRAARRLSKGGEPGTGNGEWELSVIWRPHCCGAALMRKHHNGATVSSGIGLGKQKQWLALAETWHAPCVPDRRKPPFPVPRSRTSTLRSPAAMSTFETVEKLIKDHKVEWIDLRFADMRGVQHHVTFPKSIVDASLFEDGKMFDGSSISGWRGIHQSDMVLLPDPETAFLDPFTADPTLVLTCDILDPTPMRSEEHTS